MIPAGHDGDDELYVEDSFDNQENSENASIDSRSTTAEDPENFVLLPEATVIPAALVEREVEAEHQLQMLQREMQDKQQEMDAVIQKLAQMEQMEQELNDLKSALQGKVAVAELVDPSQERRRRSRRSSSTSALQPKRTGSRRNLDPAQAKAAAAAMAPEDRKKMKEKGMDVVDFMVYQSLTEGKCKSPKSVCTARKNGLSRGSGIFSSAFSLGKNKPGSSELTDSTVLTDDSAPVSPLASTGTFVFDYKSDDDASHAKSVEERTVGKKKFKSPIKRLYLKVVNNSR